MLPMNRNLLHQVVLNLIIFWLSIFYGNISLKMHGVYRLLYHGKNINCLVMVL